MRRMAAMPQLRRYCPFGHSCYCPKGQPGTCAAAVKRFDPRDLRQANTGMDQVLVHGCADPFLSSWQSAEIACADETKPSVGRCRNIAGGSECLVGALL